MKTYTREELKQILDEHKEWLDSDYTKGKQADLGGANLNGADLSGANLRGADLRRADLSWASLSKANLGGANLNGADLRGANLCGANLLGADLRGANLCGAILSWASLHGASLNGADLRGTNLSKANLRRADLSWASLPGASLNGADLGKANLSGANLSGAGLGGANLNGADLSGANLGGVTGLYYTIIPEKGSFVAWKKVREDIVLELEIPTKAKRTSAYGSRKNRAEYVKVIASYRNGKKLRRKETYKGLHDGTEYRVGHVTKADRFDSDPRVECTHGIHFFITRQEAEDYR